jgi:hypothetical protein
MSDLNNAMLSRKIAAMQNTLIGLQEKVDKMSSSDLSTHKEMKFMAVDLEKSTPVSEDVFRHWYEESQYNIQYIARNSVSGNPNNIVQGIDGIYIALAKTGHTNLSALEGQLAVVDIPSIYRSVYLATSGDSEYSVKPVPTFFSKVWAAILNAIIEASIDPPEINGSNPTTTIQQMCDGIGTYDSITGTMVTMNLRLGEPGGYVNSINTDPIDHNPITRCLLKFSAAFDAIHYLQTPDDVVMKDILERPFESSRYVTSTEIASYALGDVKSPLLHQNQPLLHMPRHSV